MIGVYGVECPAAVCVERPEYVEIIVHDCGHGSARLIVVLRQPCQQMRLRPLTDYTTAVAVVIERCAICKARILADEMDAADIVIISADFQLDLCIFAFLPTFSTVSQPFA